MPRSPLPASRACLLLLVASVAGAADLATVAVNEYTGYHWQSEPVSFDVTLPRPMSCDHVGLKETAVWQTEPLAGTRAAATRVRVWTVVDSDHPQQFVFTVTDAPAHR